jgi:transposase InsO family protein
LALDTVVLDAFNREVIGWAMNGRLMKEIVVDAF